MGMHYLDPVQYLLEKDGTSPVTIEAEAPQQHPDACGTWRRVRLVYADGCEIVLDGENRDVQAPFIEGPEGKLYRGFRSDVPGLREKIAALPDPEPTATDFAAAVRAGRDAWKAGLMPQSDVAVATSPLTGFLAGEEAV